jgi:cytochrome c oxidase assembly protein subunit 15
MGILLIAQILLGALTVALELSPPVVTIHLGMALLLFGGLVWLAVEAFLGFNRQGTRDGNGSMAAPPTALVRRGDAQQARRHYYVKLQPLLVVAVAAVYMLMLIGAFVRATGASWACVGFPACNGQALPFGMHPLTDLHLVHRLTAYAVATYLAGTVVGIWRTPLAPRGLRLAALAVGACTVAQIAVGAGMVSTGVPALAQALHVAGAAALWASVVALFATSFHARLKGNPA